MADLRVKAVSHVVSECIMLAQKEYEKKKKKKRTEVKSGTNIRKKL